MNKNIYYEKIIKLIKSQNWYETRFPVNTNGGGGNTLEDILGIKENNFKTPDLGEIELKTTKKKNDSGLLTLFNYDRDLWKMKQIDVIKKYGKLNEDGRENMYYGFENNRKNSTNLMLSVDEKAIYLKDINEIIFEYPLNVMAETWNKKVKKTYLVKFEEKKIADKKHFKYTELINMTRTVDVKDLKSFWENNLLIIETRMHVFYNSKNEPVSRNHGTSIRIKLENISKIFEIVSQ